MASLKYASSSSVLVCEDWLRVLATFVLKLSPAVAEAAEGSALQQGSGALAIFGTLKVLILEALFFSMALALSSL